MAIAAYLRFSTERQDLDNQRYAVGEHCKAHGLTLGDVVTDTKSGKLSWRDRDLASLIERLAPGDILVTPELSRLSRSLQDVFSFLAETARRQIIVRVIKGNFVIDGSLQSTVLVTAFGLAAEIEREFISQRTKEALARKKREGQTLGRPVGSKNTKTKLSGHEETINNYLKLGLSASAVAKLVKVHPETIRRYARSVPQTSSPAVLPLPTFEPTQKTATIRLRLEVENNSSFVRGRKRARQDIENFHLAQYEMQKLSDDEYELVIPYDDDADLDEQVHQLLSDISIEADNRHCFIDADVREKVTERSW